MELEEVRIISHGRYWVCENMDTLAPIIEEGTDFLLSDGRTISVKDGDTTSVNYRLIKCMKFASEKQKMDYARKHYKIIFCGDPIIIKRGRKMVGEYKTVSGYYRYDVPGTYGHQYVEYLKFTDGTKCNINNCDVEGIEYDLRDEYRYNSKVLYFRYYEPKLSDLTFQVGGRK